MIVTLPLPLSATDFPDPPEVFITYVALNLAIGALPYFGAFPRRDDCSRPMLSQRVITFSLIIGSIGTDLLNLPRDVRENICQGFGITQVIGAGHRTQDFERRLVNTEVDFSPGAALAAPVLADFPLSFAVDFDAGRINPQVTRLVDLFNR